MPNLDAFAGDFLSLDEAAYYSQIQPAHLTKLSILGYIPTADQDQNNPTFHRRTIQVLASLEYDECELLYVASELLQKSIKWKVKKASDHLGIGKSKMKEISDAGLVNFTQNNGRGDRVYNAQDINNLLVDSSYTGPIEHYVNLTPIFPGVNVLTLQQATSIVPYSSNSLASLSDDFRIKSYRLPFGRNERRYYAFDLNSFVKSL